MFIIYRAGSHLINTNGPAVALVNGAESTGGRMQECGEDQSFYKAKGSECVARPDSYRDLPSWYKLVQRWRNRGTNFRVYSNNSRCRNFFEAAWCSIAVQTWTKPVITPGAGFAGWQMSVSGYNSLQDFNRKQD